MAERRRGTQGRPMIYGKSPESRRYWNIAPDSTKEQTKTAADRENQLQNEKKDTGKTAAGLGQENQKAQAKDRKQEGGRLHFHRKTNSSDGRPMGRRSDTQPRKTAQGSGERRKRTGSHGEQKKLRMLWTVFGVLCVLLVVAMIYEIGLGNGTKLPGSERITQPTRQEQNKTTSGITLQKNQTEEAQTEPAAQTEEVQTEAAVKPEDRPNEAAEALTVPS